jgi:hypothetical protein
MRKSQVEYILGQFSDEFSLEDFVEKLIVVEKINVAERSLAENGGVPHDEVVRRMHEFINKRRDEQHRVVA